MMTSSGRLSKCLLFVFSTLVLLAGKRVHCISNSSNSSNSTNDMMNNSTTAGTTNNSSNITSLLFFNDIPVCNRTSLQISKLKANESIPPCLLYHIEPTTPLFPNKNGTMSSSSSSSSSNRTNTTRSTIITTIMVTDALCQQHRDGALVGIEALNGDNDGRGVAIGFQEDYYLQFRHVSVVVGNKAFLGVNTYNQLHTTLLESMLEYYQQQDQFVYIIGTCSQSAAIEKKSALKYETILLAQVGPPSFYMEDNPWLFGIHIDSDTYTVYSTRRLQFLADATSTGRSGLPIRVIYRTTSEFFYSTCQSAINILRNASFTDLVEILYDPAGDDDQDGIVNSMDEDFLRRIADQTCPPGSSNSTTFPALLMCTLTEHDIILARLKENGCRLSALWLTASTWPWALNNQGKVVYFLGAGQWHASMTYSDRYYATGNDVIARVKAQQGYEGGYDVVVSYAVPVLFSQHLQAAYRISDHPDPIQDYLDPTRRENLRRQMVNLRADSIFGPVQFNAHQRNQGREAAASQWLPMGGGGDVNGTTTINNNGTSVHNALVSPISQAEAAAVIPAASAWPCKAGMYTTLYSRTTINAGILSDKCSLCPIDSYSTQPNHELQCLTCANGSSTEGLTGSTYCVRYNDNLLSPGLLSFGYLVVGLSWIMSLVCLGWIFRYRKDPVVRLAQIEFLVLICIGGIISTSAIFGLTFQASTDQDTTPADRACRSVPYLYTIGWALQYSCISAKTIRLHKIISNPAMHRIKVSATSISWIVAISMVVNIALVTIWTVMNPLSYVRWTTNKNVELGLVTIESIGRCRPAGANHSVVWWCVALLIIHHILLLVVTHVLLYKVRHINDRYQEHKYIQMAALFSLEVLFIGLPILIAAKDSVGASFLVMAAIVALDNIGVLGFIFIPKMFYQRQGLESGVSVGESIIRDTHDRAVQRENTRRLLASTDFVLSSREPLDMAISRAESEVSSRVETHQLRHEPKSKPSCPMCGRRMLRNGSQLETSSEEYFLEEDSSLKLNKDEACTLVSSDGHDNGENGVKTD